MAFVSNGDLYTLGPTATEATNVDFMHDALTAVAVGFHHTAVISGGKLYTFGMNTHGQLGDGTTYHNYCPTEITVLRAKVTAVAAGSYHTAVISDGKLFTFGNNAHGQLGDGTTVNRYHSTKIACGACGEFRVCGGSRCIWRVNGRFWRIR